MRAPPDGYTLFLVSPTNAINATLYDKLNFDFIRDIAPVASINRIPIVMEVNPSFPAKTVPELIAYAKANPGKINMASAGNGTAPYMAGRAVQDDEPASTWSMCLIAATANCLTDLLGGQVQVVFGGISASIEHIRAGKLRALAVTTATRSEALPDIPTVGEFVPGYEASGWCGIGAPEEHAGRDHRQAQQRDQCRLSPIPRSRRGLPTWAAPCFRARPPTSASSSPTKPRNGAK